MTLEGGFPGAKKSPETKSILNLEQRLAKFSHIKEVIPPSQESKDILALANELKTKNISFDERLEEYLKAPLIIDDFPARYDEGRNEFEDTLRQANPALFELYSKNRLRNNVINNVILYIQKLKHQGILDAEDQKPLQEFYDQYLEHTDMKLELEERKAMVGKLDALVQRISKRYLSQQQESMRKAA